jgi:hypothetical protein
MVQKHKQQVPLLAYVKHIKYTTKKHGKEDSKVVWNAFVLLNITKCKMSYVTLLKIRK